MRCHPAFTLAFLLPPGSTADSGAHQPSPEGCRLTVTAPLVEISGPSREAVFEHAARFLRVACKDVRASISAFTTTLEKPAGRDSWQIVVGADVAFVPTAVDAQFPRQARPPPDLEHVAGQAPR